MADKGLYRHVVLFRFNEGASEQTLRGIEKAFAELAAKLPFVKGFEWGRNSSPEGLDHGYTHCFIVTFQNAAGRDAYLPHPDHQAFCRTHLDPHLAEVCVLDFDSPGVGAEWTEISFPLHRSPHIFLTMKQNAGKRPAVFLALALAGVFGGGSVYAAPNSAKDLAAFVIGGATGTIQDTAITVDLAGQPLFTGVNALAATFKATGKSVRVGSRPQVSGKTLNDFTKPVRYTVVAADGSTKEYTVRVLTAKIVSISGYADTLVVGSDGSLWGTGRNGDGQLGTGKTDNVLAPKQILPGDVASVAAGYYHTLILKKDGTLWATGYAKLGQLGNGGTESVAAPVQVADSVAFVSAGVNFSLVVKKDGSLWVSGANASGQLGTGKTDNVSALTQIMDSGVASVSGGEDHSLIVKADGSLWAMGSNGHGQLGTGTTTDSRIPVQVVTSGVAAASAGRSHSLFVKTDGSLWGMGYNKFGQMGTGATADVLTPVQIMPGGVASVSAGGDHTLIVKTDGSLWAMGYNKNGQLGNGGKDDVLTPTQILAGGVAAAAGGLVHSVILKTDHSLWATGYNNNGELGNGTGTGVLAPVQIRRPSLSADDQ